MKGCLDLKVKNYLFKISLNNPIILLSVLIRIFVVIFIRNNYLSFVYMKFNIVVLAKQVPDTKMEKMR